MDTYRTKYLAYCARQKRAAQAKRPSRKGKPLSAETRSRISAAKRAANLARRAKGGAT